jgi:CDP-diglyceride synthetase
MPADSTHWAGVISGSFAGAALILCGLFSRDFRIFSAATWCAGLAAVATFAIRQSMTKSGSDPFFTGVALGLMTSGILSSAWYLFVPRGNEFLALAVWSTWAGDGGASLLRSETAGTRTPIWKWVNPRKSWEGVAVAGVFTTIFSLLFLALFHPPIKASAMLLLLLVVPITGPLGDLLESALKRLCGVEESGRLPFLPGHGGVLDRIDSLSVTLPVLFVSWELLLWV